MLTVPLKEIKPPVEMNIPFPWETIALPAGALLLVGALFLFAFFRRERGKQKRRMARREVIKFLEQVDFSLAKEGAYRATILARKAVENREERKALARLEQRLAAWKYKKDPPPFNDEGQTEVKDFLRLLKKGEK